jgi:hypothetical protein
VADETWTYPASAFDPGDRVCVDDEGHPWHDETGTVIGPDDQDEGTWLVRLDDDTEITAYAHELTGVNTPAPPSPSPERTEP